MKDEIKKVSILMLTHNALRYVLISIVSVRKRTDYANYELVVLDNKSKWITRQVLKILKKLGYIDILIFLSYNSLFAKGNNIAAAAATRDTDLLLLLNSDVKVINRGWLNRLTEAHHGGIAAYGVVEDPVRVDGYCYLIDVDLYKKYPLDESFEWWWGITKQQAEILNGGYPVIGFRNHADQLRHYGGKSGSDFKRAKGMNVTRRQVNKWFNGKNISVE